VKINNQAAAPLKEQDIRGVKIEITPELREKFERVSHEIIDLLRAKTIGPLEAYAVLRFVMDGLEEVCGIRGAVIANHDETTH
jgi:hypothetical protein